ncbi:hypothetical protein [Acinetobacter thermotolerans]|uniref:hypothetical protein n=1 Tax=Acinetobacter thermotolerans TaxID=3151487 RepID=UPI00325BAC49
MTDFILSEKSKAEFVEYIAQDGIECWFEGDRFVMPSGQGRTAKGIVIHKLQVWKLKEAAIQEMDEVIKLQDADLRKYEKQIESLKEQLNNMEACYIEKKKEVEDRQKRIDEYEKLTTSIRNEFNLWIDGREFADVIEAQIENLEALRGGHE